MAEKSLFIVISRIVWGFEIRKKRDTDGNVVEPATKMMPGFLSVPEMFECDITCRSAEREKVIRAASLQAEKDGLHYRE